MKPKPKTFKGAKGWGFVNPDLIITRIENLILPEPGFFNHVEVTWAINPVVKPAKKGKR